MARKITIEWDASEALSEATCKLVCNFEQKTKNPAYAKMMREKQLAEEKMLAAKKLADQYETEFKRLKQQLAEEQLAKESMKHESKDSELKEQKPMEHKSTVQPWLYRYDDHFITSLTKTPGQLFTELSMGYDKAIPIPAAINDGKWRFKFTLSPLFATQSLKVKNAALELELLQQESQKNEKEHEIRIKQLEKNYNQLLRKQNELNDSD